MRYWLIIFIVLHTKIFAIQYSPFQLIKKADNYRGFNKDFLATIKIISHKKDKVNTKEMKVYVKGLNKSLVVFIKPKKDEGKKLLMVDDNLWIYIPTTRRPIRLTPKQILLGQVSYGDIARTNYQQDYIPTKIQKEICDKNISCYHITLIKKRKGASYYRIEYHIAEKDFIPIKAIFFAKSGKRLKTAYFSNLKYFYNERKITKLTIYDNIKKGEWSEIIITSYKLHPIPNIFFNKEYLKRIDIE
jgi:outer membrane lipoprotein-sorting protein